MRLTIIMKDPEAGDIRLPMSGPAELGNFLIALAHDLAEHEPEASFTITIEKEQEECQIQLLN